MIKFIKNYLFGLVDNVVETNAEPKTKIKETVLEKELQKTDDQFINEYNGFKVGDTVYFIKIPLGFENGFYSGVDIYLKNTTTSESINILESDILKSGREFLIDSIEKFRSYDNVRFKAKSENLELIFWNSDLNKDCICKKEELSKYEKIIEAENNFKVEFIIRKLEGREDYSIWWRSVNHPNYMEWVSIFGKECSKGEYKPYVFFSKIEAEEALEILKTRNPKTLRFFERKWKDI